MERFAYRIVCYVLYIEYKIPLWKLHYEPLLSILY